MGKWLYRFQQGGVSPSLEEQIQALVSAAMQGDKAATKQIQQIQAAAQQGDQKAMQLFQMIQEVIQQMQGTQMAKKGAKVGICPKCHKPISKCTCGGRVKKASAGIKCPCILKRFGGRIIEVDSCTGLPIAKKGIKIPKAAAVGSDYKLDKSNTSRYGFTVTRDNNGMVDYGADANANIVGVTVDDNAEMKARRALRADKRALRKYARKYGDYYEGGKKQLKADLGVAGPTSTRKAMKGEGSGFFGNRASSIYEGLNVAKEKQLPDTFNKQFGNGDAAKVNVPQGTNGNNVTTTPTLLNSSSLSGMGAIKFQNGGWLHKFSRGGGIPNDNPRNLRLAPGTPLVPRIDMGLRRLFRRIYGDDIVDLIHALNRNTAPQLGIVLPQVQPAVQPTESPSVTVEPRVATEHTPEVIVETEPNTRVVTNPSLTSNSESVSDWYKRKGIDVAALQSLLEEAGFSVGKAGADGKFGKDTLKAVIDFQRANGLVRDGKAGQKTMDMLRNAVETRRKRNSGPYAELQRIIDADTRAPEYSVPAVLATAEGLRFD